MNNNIRITSRAVIEINGKYLMMKYNDKVYGNFYCCIGGGQLTGESMGDNLRRECLEEISCEVEIGELLFTREVVFINTITREKTHQIEHYFSCKIKNGFSPQAGAIPDLTSAGFALLSDNELRKVQVFPESFADMAEKGFPVRYLCEMQ